MYKLHSYSSADTDQSVLQAVAGGQSQISTACLATGAIQMVAAIIGVVEVQTRQCMRIRHGSHGKHSAKPGEKHTLFNP